MAFLRVQLKSKLHHARVTDGNVNYIGSITIPGDLMDEVDLWEGEKVMVVDNTNGARLETYALRGSDGSGAIVMNGGSARLMHIGDRITIMSFALSDEKVEARKLVLDEHNRPIRS